MGTYAFETIKTLLHLMTEKEKEVIAKLLQMQGTSVPTASVEERKPTTTPNQQLLQTVINKQIKNPVNHNVQKRDLKGLVELESTLDSFIGTQCRLSGVTLDKSVRVAFYTLSIQLISESLKERQIPVSFRTVVSMAGKVTGLVGTAYPGMVEAGLFVPVVLLQTMSKPHANSPVPNSR